MTDWTCAGMALDTDGPDDLVQPLSAAVVIKGLDSDDKISYWIASTEGITGVEALGMFTWAAHMAAEES